MFYKTEILTIFFVKDDLVTQGHVPANATTVLLHDELVKVSLIRLSLFQVPAAGVAFVHQITRLSDLNDFSQT